MKPPKIKGAIRTDFILSAEIIIIALGELTEASLLTRIISLSIVGIGITILFMAWSHWLLERMISVYTLSKKVVWRSQSGMQF